MPADTCNHWMFSSKDSRDTAPLPRAGSSVTRQAVTPAVTAERAVSGRVLIKAKADELVRKQMVRSTVRTGTAPSERAPVDDDVQVKVFPAIRISDRTAEVLRFMTGAEGDDGPRRVIRQYLEVEERRTRNERQGERIAGFDARLAPVADVLERLGSEVSELITTSRTTNLQAWEAFMGNRPPSAAAVALLLVGHSRGSRAAFAEGAVEAVSKRQSQVAKCPRPRSPETHPSVIHRSVVVAAMRAARNDDQGFKAFMRSAAMGSVDGISIREVLIEDEEMLEIVLEVTDVVQHRRWDALRTWWTMAGKRC